MNNRYKIAIFGLLVTVALSSCDDFLDQVPDNRADPKTPQAVGELLVSAYAETGYISFTELMTDNAGDVGKWSTSYDRTQEEAYYWKVVTGDDLDSPEGFWDAAYGAISICNHALEIIDKHKDEGDYDARKGEALVSRAYHHFMLVNIFAKHYDPATAATDMGIPYVTTRETEPLVDYTRLSVDSVYTLIERDMLEGMSLIDDTKYTVPKFHFTVSSTAAFAARFYQYRAKQGDWDKVIKYTNRILPAEPTKLLRDWNGTYADYTYAELEQAYTHSDQTCNLLLMGQVSIWGRYYSNRYKITSAIFDRVLNGKKVYGTARLAYPIFGASVFNHIPKYKEHFKRESINASTGWPYIMAPAFTTDEALLNRIEAYVMTENYDKALADLNYYYSKRIDLEEYKPITDKITMDKVRKYTSTIAPRKLQPCYELVSQDQKDFMEVVADARRQEFLEEGLRWFDIRRFKISVTHKSFNEKVVEELKSGDLRYQAQIPTQAISLGLTPNPR